MKTHMRVEEVAVELGVSMGTVYNYRKDGLLHQERMGRKQMFVRAEVMQLKARLAVAGALRAQPETEVAA